MAEEIVSVSFSIGVEPFVLYDAISLPRSLFDTWTQADFDAEKQRRYDEWIAIVNPPAPPEE